MLDEEVRCVPAVVAALPAEIDMASQEAAYGKLYAALAAGAPVVVADFSATRFCDCSSLSRLLAVQQDAASRNARLLAVIPSGSPVGRLAGLVSLDTRMPVYSSLREAEDQVPEVCGNRLWSSSCREVVRMADIVDVIVADRAEIMKGRVKFSELADQRGNPGFGQAQAAVWDTLAGLIGLHLSAVDEICVPAVYSGARGLMRRHSVLCEHEDVRELIREARLQPSGSALRRQLTNAALVALSRQADGEKDDILADLRRADPRLRQRLARQWRAFTEAQIRDMCPEDEEDAVQTPNLTA